MSAAELFTLILSIIGACAWIPEICKMIISNRTRLEGNIIDVLHIKDFTMKCGKENVASKKGQMIIIAVDFFTYYEPLIIHDYKVNIVFHKQEIKPVKTIIGNRVQFKNHDTNGFEIPMELDLPIDSNFFLNPLLDCNKNNVRIIPCLVENMSYEKRISMYDIKELEFIYKKSGRKRMKKITVHCNDERFSMPSYIVKYAVNK